MVEGILSSLISSSVELMQIRFLDEPEGSGGIYQPNYVDF